MYCLAVIHKINADAAKAPKRETDQSRRCSYHRSSRGIVLHSARNRSTAFIEGKRRCDRFEVEWSATNSADKRDALVESYFNTLPTGKQKIAPRTPAAIWKGEA